MSIIEKLFLNVQGDHVAVSYDLHRFRSLLRDSGQLIGFGIVSRSSACLAGFHVDGSPMQ